MLREILFRAKAVESNEWVCGSLEQYAGHQTRIYVDDGTIYGERVVVDTDTVGQYTGLHDKCGNKIFEGDIVKTQFGEEPFGVVRWHINGYWFIRETFEDIERGLASHLPLGELMYHVIDGERITLEVIGNIYDKKEGE